MRCHPCTSCCGKRPAFIWMCDNLLWLHLSARCWYSLSIPEVLHDALFVFLSSNRLRRASQATLFGFHAADALLNRFPRDVRSIMCDGITWLRLQSLATTPVLECGLGLFREMPRVHKAIFGNALGGIVDGRSESVCNFLASPRDKGACVALGMRP